MKIREIYKREGGCRVSLTMAGICLVITLIAFLWPNLYNAFGYAFPTEYPWQMFTGMFLHGSPEFSIWITLAHLGFNLLLLLPFGILIEKIIGSLKFFRLTVYLWAVNAISFFIVAGMVTPQGEVGRGAGISGIAFSYGIIGGYIMVNLVRRDWKMMFKQVSFYLLMNMVFIMMVMINSSTSGTSPMFIHIIAVIAGIGYLIVKHKDIDTLWKSQVKPQPSLRSKMEQTKKKK